ncbi:hypothetical protein OH749_22855 [Streptomyces albidoflavus]|uniref:hypothetical protein n=1 Tax=Streptomyces albidoflavus TaxID=1886 RepID=UPI0030932C53|nr:hypothetical protein OG919_08075 [Streptomyces albidoflavus]WSD52838.1 hypothetical protein OHA76_08780 [Streptomyces albidoflavus]WTC31878.1 hypothetical protein OH749_22855 [Streptomyces albidoflavus]
MTPAIDERERIRAAMDRILGGTPQRTNGALTIVALATEADVSRNALTQRHLDLKNEFYGKVRARGELPDSEKRLRRQLVKAKELRSEALKKIEALKADNEALVGALHQAVMENRQLRLQLTEQPSNIRVLPTQPRPPVR